MRPLVAAIGVALAMLSPQVALGQAPATRLAILQAEDRRAASPRDLAVLRSGARSGNAQTARVALRALGRLERPALIADIVGGLRHSQPEVRAEAANAAAQAAGGWREGGAPAAALASLQATLIARLRVEAEASVRAALCESIARLPYSAAADAARAEATLLEFAAQATSNTDRLGVAKGLEAFTRLHRTLRPVGPPLIDLLRQFARRTPDRSDQELLRDARVRRLALESLTTLNAADAETVSAVAADPDPQVRRLAVRAALVPGTEAVVARGLNDPASMVRIEALRTMRTRSAREACDPALTAVSDPDITVAMVAIDQLAGCSESPAALAYLGQAVADLADAEAPRNWHRAAHALLALAAAAPDQAGPALVPFLGAKTWQLRMYAARAAAALSLRPPLERLAQDADDNVVEVALNGLSTLAGHEADPIFVAALAREGHQVVRVAARALASSPNPEAAIPALKTALQRAESDGRPGAADARAALRATLTSLGAAPRIPKPGTLPGAPLNAADLRRLASPRARVVMRDVGTFDMALFTLEAPATVLRFAQLAESGYYNGLTFHRIVPNGIIQGGSPGANEYISNSPYMRDEVGLWPHVRGALGISTRGRDTGDAQIFIDLVDNPRYDHTYTVFAQVLNGMDVVDRIIEGDVIESIEILP
ncbi:MAG: peptidylprolyl isomerase [Vicinamibacterales bacterium]